MDTSPQVYARLSGTLYLLIILFGGFSDGYVINTLVVPGDFAATAHNIMASTTLWRLGVITCLIVPMLAVAQLLPAYLLIRPVSRKFALAMIFFNIVSLSVESISKIFLLMVLPILENPGYDKIFEPQQIYVFINILVVTHNITFNVALIFFGGDCLITGYLVFKSKYFPRFLGVLLQISGISYLIGSSTVIFAPGFDDVIALPLMILAFIGELSYCLWLLVMGVNVVKWNERVALRRVPAVQSRA
jgi:hypothetical protein